MDGTKLKLHAKGHEISVIAYEDQQDYISLTDIAKQKNPDAPAAIIKNWLRSRSTIEFLGFWESLNNSAFKLVEVDQFKSFHFSNYFILFFLIIISILISSIVAINKSRLLVFFI